MDYSPAFSSIYSVIEMAKVTFFVAVIVSAVVCGMFAVTVARAKNLSATEWFWAAFFCNFVALIALAGMPSLPPKADIPALEQ